MSSHQAVFRLNKVPGAERCRRSCSQLFMVLSGLLLSAQLHAITPVQTYYVPLEEADIQPTLAELNPGNTSNTIVTVISIAVGFDGTEIHYDHSEDGYEADLTAPSQPTTQIWGDGDATNGAPPGFPLDALTAGDVIILANPVNPFGDPDILFDAADKFIVSAPVAVTRAAWADTPGTVLAGAVEVYPTNQWGTQFEGPVGEDIAIEDDEMFELVTVSYMAAEDGTVVSCSTLEDFFLDEGESFYIPPAAPVPVGVTCDSNKPVQVHAITGDIGAVWESRWAILFPRNLWTSEYFVPVSTRETDTADYTDVFLYNPNDEDITVDWQTTGPTAQPSIAVPAGGNARVTMPNGTGARFYTLASEIFYAIVTVDSNPDVPENGGTDSDDNNRDYDWGFTSMPPSLLSSQALVGFAPSIDPNACAPGAPFDCSPPPAEDRPRGSPVWVMSVDPDGADVLIDYDADPSTGDLIDFSFNRYDAKVSLAGLERAKIFDPNDWDMTGALLYTEDGTFISVAWGQDPEESVRTNPYLDAGTVIPPLPSFTLLKDVDKSLVVPGETLQYTITITNTSRSRLTGIVLSDELPPFTEYVADSSTLDGAPFADDGIGTAFPLDEGGATLPGTLAAGDSYVFTFEVTVNADTPPGVDLPDDCEDPQTRLLNEATAVWRSFTSRDDALTCVAFNPDIDIEKLTNGVDADDPAAGDAPQIAPGDAVTWTYIVTNTGDVTLTNIVVTDDRGVAVDCPTDTLDPGASTECTASGLAELLDTTPALTVPGICGDNAGEVPLYENMGTATGEFEAIEVEDTDPSHYCNPPVPDIDIEKATNGVDADDANAGDAPQIAPGDVVTWTYEVTNTGEVALDNVVVVDDRGVAVDCPQTTLAIGESITCTASGTAEELVDTPDLTVPGMCGNRSGEPLYENMGTATGFYAGDPVEDTDPSHYCNPEPPGGGEGCTPGYWKQKHHFDSWAAGIAPNDPFSDYFEDAFPGKTLLQVLKQGGGGLKALGRHTVAALLNSASPDVDYDVNDVAAQFNALYPASKGQYNALKNEFEGFNEQGCPLN